MASLVADYSSASETDNEDADSESDTKSSEGNDGCGSAAVEKLPRPDFGAQGVAIVRNSVFSNPFIEAENAKKAILEKHVKMTPTQDEVKMINGKKICWNFRKGRCRFGHKCKFAHDSDLQSAKPEASEAGEQDLVVAEDNGVAKDVETGKATTMTTKKKRPGLSQSLVPGKKVMKMYKSQTLRDNPWKKTKKTKKEER
ncbi:uncharacterized protein LOC134539812 isoform X2 [Bacillus rossius redtenbacheri]|uniref:uncharacterized protein LOC134539812 isoform X2 n=1 Tax=Bacillus rossius redtenbacheri TaxID=93214 RepID=UPI002FDCB9F8